MSGLNIIKQLEKILNTTLEKTDKIRWENRGYALNINGHVTFTCLTLTRVLLCNILVSVWGTTYNIVLFLIFNGYQIVTRNSIYNIDI